MNKTGDNFLYTALWTENHDQGEYFSKLYPRSLEAAKEWLASEIERNASHWGRTEEEIQAYLDKAQQVRAATGRVLLLFGRHDFSILMATKEEIDIGKAIGDTNDYLPGGKHFKGE